MASFVSYLRFCLEKQVRPVPATFCTIAGFLIAFVVSVKGRTASVHNKLSHVHVSFVMRSWEWLNQADSRSVGQVIKALEFDDYTKTKRMKPLVVGLLEQIFERRGGARSTPMCLLIKTVFATAHDGLLRGGEMTSGLLGSDVEMGSKHMTIRVDRAKRHRKGEPGSIRIAAGNWYGNSVQLMRRWLKARKLDVKDERFLFPNVTFKSEVPTGLDFTSSLTYTSLVSLVRHEVKQLGLNPFEFAAHSFRAGGATDLFLSGKMGLPMIMKYGRWKSMEAALLYYREEEEIAKEASQIFTQARVGY